ncbi:MAG: catechol 2,3-dioxygenase-like lactoylglutathione lyase family enzyme [Bacteroidia bacterium]|jgi:catechol 2,3-dioxygenase-like lactoylglutathione lyase family enzyme
MEPRISIISLGVADISRSHTFYDHGLGFPTSAGPDAEIVFFQTGGTCLDLYPLEKLAARVGGRLVKPAQAVFWGGYSGYFSEPDGYLWEVADGSLVIE